MTDDIRLEQDGPIASVILNRPEKKNALNRAMWEAIPTLMKKAEEDPAVKVVVIHGGSAKAFAAGADISEFGNNGGGAGFRDTVFAAMHAIGDCVKPVIAMISGPCIGGGCGIALACDLRFADDTAKFGITPAKLGIAYGLYDTKRVVEAVGAANAKDILFTARIMGAEEAKAINLVDRLVPASDLKKMTWDYAHTICANSQFSVRASKKTVQLILDGATDDTPDSESLFADAFSGEDFKEGTKAFLEKRKPNFKFS